MDRPASAPALRIQPLQGGGSLRYEQVESANGLKLPIGLIETHVEAHWSSETCAGICAGFLVGSGISFSLGQHQVIDCSGARSFVVHALQPWQARHQVTRNSRVQAVFLQFPTQLLHALEADIHHASLAVVHDWVPDYRLMAMLEQIVSCPFQGVARTLYMQGKSLELLATVIDSLSEKGREQRQHNALPRPEVERLQQAYELLQNHLDKPPGLEELARQVGMCSSRLTAGFRRQFGQSVTECLQDLRLAQAYQDLQSGRLSSSQAAYRIGYSPAYFSTLFKRKYACSPRDVARAKPSRCQPLADREKQTADCERFSFEAPC
ncbi:helix-turn-helix domain-containing protein [Pseudomonas cremoricolorata]|uniref:helix-turn-helix domain-containing protein n=1 Tax=Pseudomonas cremoricolorata TaxID=157783 RepID=UPI000675CB58|nr:AraC family transcriptional regulator [Pseudomonas cremoricolorata]